MGNNSDCSFPIEEYQSKQKLVLAFLKETALQANVNVVKFDDFLCSKAICQTVLDETIIYRDKGHLSYSGSKLLGVKMDLASVLIKASY